VKATFVTGGASGIGRAVAAALLADGRPVALADRDEAALARTAAELAGGSLLDPHVVDVTDAAGLERVARRLEAGRGVDGVVNAAGILRTGTLADVDEADWDRVISINLKGVFLSCKTFMPILERGGGGSIVNIASIAGRTKSINAAPHYAASKAGIVGLSMALAAQHARAGVRVNCVAPGIIDTPMNDVLGKEALSELARTIPLGRLGAAAEVAAAIVYLLSPESSYVTGETIEVNGGLFMH
jgi:3-oxoacyl-[acyl-carrier protein] reductase